MTAAPPLNTDGRDEPVSVCLYVAGTSPNSVAALATMRALAAEFPARRIEIEIIDVLQDPLRGLRDGVMATPLLVRRQPLPERRILGNLSHRRALLSVLGIQDAD
jgi:circadian clock protein KaiB